MFDIGWAEMLIVGIVLIVVVGPKELPALLRSFGRTTTKMRAMASEFRKQFDDAMKEAELDGLKDLAKEARKLDPTSEIRKNLDPMKKMGDQIRSGLEAATRPSPSVADTGSKPVVPQPPQAGAEGADGKEAAPQPPAGPATATAMATPSTRTAATPATRQAKTVQPAKESPAAVAKSVDPVPAKAPKRSAPAKAARTSSAAAGAEKPVRAATAKKPATTKPGAKKAAAVKKPGATS